MTEQEHIGTVAMGDNKEAMIEAARNELLEWDFIIPADIVGHALTAALSSRPAQEAVAVGWPKIMYVCQRCYENAPEMCGKDRTDISVMPDGRWICNDCTHEEYDGETLLPDAPLLYAAPQPVEAVAVKALEWVEDWGGHEDDIPEWRTKTPFGNLCASVAGYRDEAGNRYDTHKAVPDSLKAKLILESTAHYERRILSALSLSHIGEEGK